jgi:hypothetical protein
VLSALVGSSVGLAVLVRRLFQSISGHRPAVAAAGAAMSSAAHSLPRALHRALVIVDWCGGTVSPLHADVIIYGGRLVVLGLDVTHVAMIQRIHAPPCVNMACGHR